MSVSKDIKADTFRYKRQGFPEAIYCPGKTTEQIVDMARTLAKGGGPVILTKLNPENADAVLKSIRGVKYYPQARMAVMAGKRKGSVKGKVTVITAGTSDIHVAEEAAITAETLKCRVQRLYDVGVAGIHRLTNRIKLLSGSSCIIVCAGMEGALPSVVGGLADCAVIAVPTSTGYGTGAGGFAALLTMLNSCAPNVACVNIDDGFGAGIVASLIAKKVYQ